MVITESKLRTVIREELINYLNEDKQVLEEKKIHDFITGILAAVAIGGGIGVKMNSAPTSGEVVQASVTADKEATSVEKIIEQNQIKFNKEDSSFSIGKENIGKLSPNVVKSIMRLKEIGYVANTGANTTKLGEINQLEEQIEKDESYKKVAAKIQNLASLKGILQTDQQKKARFIFGIIIGAAMIGLLFNNVDSIYADEKRR